MNLRRILAAIYFGPRFAFDDEPDDDDFDDWVDFVGANPDLFLGPNPNKE